MTDPDSASRPNPPDDDEALRRRLLLRAGAAGVAVLGLLGGLYLFDALYVSPPEPPAPVAAVAPAVVEPKADTETPAAEEKLAGGAATAQAEDPGRTGDAVATAEPERSAAPTGLLPPARSERPLTPPAQARMAHMQPTPLPVPVKPDAARELPVTSGPAAPAAAAAAPAPASRPIAKAVEASRQFLLQMGVFNSVANAEELRAKLELAGVPAQIEARVQVGPFASRQEAEQAREKLKELGLEPGLVVAARK